jgi:hypothetical protein
MFDWSSIFITFILATLPGMLMALSDWSNPDLGTWHRVLTGLFTGIWLIVFMLYILTWGLT